ncbi:hypothetical protein [Duganella vulcania]|uniref:OmpA family protein n=1 Tax=Duganella vulcania TaxID=2692166 RepID=A0A845GHG9_9BURK|nr:hypothetical protein [Duganella vulcania]MYM92746.1 hypothetical protein [Duganella vulcania]
MEALKIVRVAAFAGMVLCVMTARADFTGPFSTEYVIGDGETKASARLVAMDQLKKAAAASAGSYVQSTTVLDNSKDLKESVEVLTASVVRLSNVKERSSLNSAGQLVLQLSATATVDETELARRVKAVREDRAKAKLLERVQAENAMLHRNLLQIQSSLGKKIDPTATSDLLRRQAAALKGIDDNVATVEAAFEPGSIIRAAEEDEANFTAAKRIVDRLVVDAVLSSPVNVVLDGAERTGGQYVIRAHVAWQFDAAELAQALRQFLNVDVVKGDIHISEFSNQNGRGPDPLSQRLFQYLSTQGIDLVVSTGAREVRVPVLYYGDDFSTCGPYGSIRSYTIKYVCLVSKDRRAASRRGELGSEGDQVRIRVTENEAKKISQLNARMVLANAAR